MEDHLKMKITIEVLDEKEKLAIGTDLHTQLVGNPDYVNNNIILNIDDNNSVRLYIYDDVKDVPKLII